MKRCRNLPFAVLLASLVGCGSTATETTVTQVTPPQAAAESPAQTHEVRKEVAEAPAAVDSGAAPAVPKVFLTSEHAAMCRIRVGDSLPAISLPQLKGGETELASLQGKKATVVAFWGDDPWMSGTALADLAAIGNSDDVAIVGIAVKQSNNEVQSAMEKAGAEFPQLIDSDGKAFTQVGMTKLPRVYVLDDAGKIVWFDIEYSQSTYRELQQTLAVLAEK